VELIITHFTQGYKEADDMRKKLLDQVLTAHFEALEQQNYVQTDGSNIVLLNQCLSGVIYAACDNIRSRLLSVLDLSKVNTDISHSDSIKTGEAGLILFPSGSDAEFLPLIMALIRAKGQGVVYSYVTAAGEVGSGTPNASGGKHFSALAPKGHKQENNGLLSGLEGEKERIKVVQFKGRGKNGLVNFQEQVLYDDIRSKLGDSENVVVLHIVLGSKTGLVYPSLETVEKLHNEFGDRIVVVVDACQLRCKLHAVAQYTSRGYITLVTGSKFYSGPPFSGAVVLSNAMALEIESHLMAVKDDGVTCAIPIGILDYITPYDVSLNMPLLREYLQLEKPWFNIGAVLRWNVGLSVIESYAAISEDKVLNFTQSWVKDVKKMVVSSIPSSSVNPLSYLTLLEVTEGLLEGNGVGHTNTIISIGVSIEEKNDEGSHLRPLSFDEMKVYHLRMTQELHVPEHLKLEDRLIKALKTKIMLGQPVKLADEPTTETVGTYICRFIY
jgi:hypothetical protein